MKLGFSFRAATRLVMVVAAIELSGDPDAFAQGTINFNNFVPGVVDAPVIFCPGVGPASFFRTQLFISRGGLQVPNFLPSTTFLGSGDPSIGHVVPVTIEVPGVLPGEQVTVIMAVSGLFGPAEATGQSGPFTITLGGGNTVPADLVGLQSVTVGTCIPEPQPMILAAIALLALMIERALGKMGPLPRWAKKLLRAGE